MRKICVGVVLVLILGTKIAAVQTRFSAEDTGAQKRVPLPDSVLAILKQDEMVRNALTNENIPAESIPLSWFSASAVHLGDSKKMDLIVMGEAALHGSNITTFWVFCAAPHGYKLVLTAPAHDLVIKDTRFRGYRDIELASMTAVKASTSLFRFNGERYIRETVKTEPILGQQQRRAAQIRTAPTI